MSAKSHFGDYILFKYMKIKTLNNNKIMWHICKGMYYYFMPAKRRKNKNKTRTK